MSDMITRVEKALAVHFSGNRMPDMSGDPRNRLSSLQRRNLTDAAYAAIEAMRNPTGEMFNAGSKVCDEQCCNGGQANNIFNAMIDAALSQDTHSLRIVNCTCRDEASKRLCLKKNECTVIEAHTHSLPSEDR
ncbi:hypothetical protein [Mesorhizobium sp.]|uniref:hypothetical protein n=1 Tax=Mesorhizobium sp. TaxID=1871066 RepID=UPI000FE30333|nr:hypothetical protein [Mesorhizobium sp.]RWK39272.1 MAG: hypothetical protein EOR40_04480 [Mesorhizobium sp.]